MTKISIVIGTFGDSRWRDLAMSRAYPSALAQGGDVEILPVHGETLAVARNEGAAAASGDWILWLDADDELGEGYLDAMYAALANVGPTDALLAPRVEWIHGRRAYPPRFMPRVDIDAGNWLVIGTVTSKREWSLAGGFEEWPLYEDWALFARIQKAGGTVVEVPDAIYRAHRSGRGRNHPKEGRRAKLAAHDAIRRAVFPELYEEAV